MNAPDIAGLARTGNAAPDRLQTVNLLILALGGEGGGVLADWLVASANAAGLPVQATSVPGVAQRTGATSYYLEMLRAPISGDRAPVFGLSPTPGDIDLLVSSELLETGRALERGLTDPTRTVLLSSTARVLTVAEKMQMGDGRLDPDRIHQAAQALCRQAIFFDMAEQTRAAGTVISSVMFGAIAGSGVLPIPRDRCEATIRAGGLAVDASLKGFALGFESVRTASGQDPRTVPDSSDTESLAKLLAHGRARVRDFQDEAYEALYLSRVQTIAQLERQHHDSDSVSAQAARYLALWMAYEDVIRVGDLKSRPARLDRIRQEAGATADQPLLIREFFKPGLEEIAAILPPTLATRLLSWGRRRGIHSFGQGMRLHTSSVHGWLLLRALASLRRWRPRSSRFQQEQVAIETWLDALAAALRLPGAEQHRLAMEIALCPRLLKGYGETWARGRASFESLMSRIVRAPSPAGDSAARRADRLRAAREAALADPQGRALAQKLGLPPPSLKAHPIRIVRRQR